MYQLNMLGMSNSRLVEVMNAKPFNPDAFLAGHKHATLKRRAAGATPPPRRGQAKGVGHSDRNFMPKLTLLRGLPGSGKTTRALELAAHGARHCEADMYHLVDGAYVFNRDKLSAAHKWCLETACRWMIGGQDCCVSNTFTQWWELQPYVEHAFKHGVDVEIITCTGTWPNVHGVPEQTLAAMSQRFESDAAVQAKLRHVQETYHD